MNKSNTSTAYRKELRQKILTTATAEFRKKGIKAVKMDDIAGILSVSKRTVYEIYDNKEQLLMESVKSEHQSVEMEMDKYVSSGKRHVIDIMLEFYKLKMQSLTGVNPIYYAELRRYPEIIAWLEKQRNNSEKKSHSFFAKGVKEGYFREDANYELVSKVANGALVYIMENELYKTYDLKDIFRDVIMHFVRGLCTLKGISELDRQIAELDK